MTALITRKSVRFDCGSRFYLLLSGILASTFFPVLTKAQNLDTIHFTETLAPVTIRDARLERNGYAIWTADSLPVNGVLSASDRLLWENTLDVRANAPGTLATLSIRGVGASRTPVFWNGLNLQSPMNGVVDAALMPIWPGDKLEIQYGGQSAAQNRGGMAGAIIIQQGLTHSKKPFVVSLGAALGSFGKREFNGATSVSRKRISSSFRVAGQRADNDFPFQKLGLDGKSYRTKQPNNFTKRIDFQQFNRWSVNHKNMLKTALWIQRAFRELPPATTESTQETWQKDRSSRALVSWEHAPDNRTFWTTRLAWIDDFLAFHLANDTDTSRSRQAFISTERSTSIGKHWAWRVGGTSLRQWAKVDGYSDSTRWFGQTQLAGYTMAEWKKDQVRLSLVIRQEWAEAQAAPFTGSVAGQFSLGKLGETKFHFSRNFNLPTLNDRYWDKLGNPNLRPEKGYSSALDWAFRKPDFSIELNGFQLILNDWILWQPDHNGLFRPDNLRKVWSRGIEAFAEFKMPINSESEWKAAVSGRLRLSKTTNIAAYDGSPVAAGMQLPYTSKASGNLSVQASRSMFSAAFLQQFTGQRLDNTGKQIDAFTTGVLLVSCVLLKKHLNIDFRLENLWNAQYEIIRYRPMPERNWRLGISYQW
ncbi:MAG: TonB-dependent receptor plug domain-containing protein [Saprospiraceae bacterium]